MSLIIRTELISGVRILTLMIFPGKGREVFEYNNAVHTNTVYTLLVNITKPVEG